MKTYLEYREGKTTKFWQIEVDGDTRTVTQGKVGAKKPPAPKTKTFKSADAAANNHDKEVAKKLAARYFDPTSLESLLAAHAPDLEVPDAETIERHMAERPYLSDDYVDVYRTGALSIGVLSDFGQPAEKYAGPYADLYILGTAGSAADHIDTDVLDPFFYIVGELADGSTLVHVNQGKWAGRVALIEHGPSDDMPEHIVEGDPDATLQAWIDAGLMEPVLETTFSAFVLDRILHYKGGAVDALRAREAALVALEEKIAGDPAAVEELDLSKTGLRALPDRLGECTNLRTLNLYNNELHRVPSVVRKLARLESLDLGYNGIEMASVPGWLAELPLRELNLSINWGEVFPGALTRIETLESLELSEVATIPASIASLSRLRHLRINGVTEAIEPDGLTRCGELRSLDLGKVRFPLPEDIGNLSRLESLVCLTPQIDDLDLPASLTRLSGLRKLSIEGAKLPQQLGGLSSLESLKVAGHAHGLPDGLADLETLRSLDLHYCRATALPEDIGRLGNLEWLKLESSYIESLPESFRELSSLTWLSLATAGDLHIGNRLETLDKLEYLALSYPAVPTIEGSLAGLRSLKNLRIYRDPGPDDDWKSQLAFIHELPALEELGICYALQKHFAQALPGVKIS